MNEDCGIPLASLLVDGGMTINNLLMQLQADILGISVGMSTKHISSVINLCSQVTSQ